MGISRALLILLSAMVAGTALTWLARAYALRRSILDVPNERSSHAVATPRGGGVAIVVPVLLAVVMLWLRGGLDTPLLIALALCGGFVAALGWIDDHRPLGIAVRAGGHLLAAAVAVVAVGANLSPGLLPIYALGIAWFLNLYNFLDGTDGYAGTQAVCAALAGTVLFVHAGDRSAAIICLTIAGASAGFLVWNWPPARIFMGDVGSCFLGFAFGVLAVHGEAHGVAPAWLWLVVIGVFFWDATLTLLRRAWQGEPWHQAHRTHAYQRLHQIGWSHRRIAISMLVVNVIVVWPVVWVAVLWDNFALIAAVAASLVMIGLWGLVIRRHQIRAGSNRLD
jgi:Fuc2NAc and GlcNAc transferase